MTIITDNTSRNADWHKSTTGLGQKLLRANGWKPGLGLGKNQDGITTHLMAKRRTGGVGTSGKGASKGAMDAESVLGIGADTDRSGKKGWDGTVGGFEGVLGMLQDMHGVGDTSTQRRKRKKKKKKDNEKNSTISLPQNKVVAGYAAKMRAAKDLSTKTTEEMAAIFGTSITCDISSSSLASHSPSIPTSNNNDTFQSINCKKRNRETFDLEGEDVGSNTDKNTKEKNSDIHDVEVKKEKRRKKSKKHRKS